jgi:hypothetical protein
MYDVLAVCFFGGHVYIFTPLGPWVCMTPEYLSLQPVYEAYDAAHRPPEPERAMSAMQLFCKRRKVCGSLSAFDRISQCRRGLEALDRQGWLRSYHQKQFHEQFIRACARIFYKTEPPGTFQRDHQRLLQANGWNNLSQEILISTPRRCESYDLNLIYNMMVVY